MQLKDLKIQFTLEIPAECPDENGVRYSAEAIRKSIAGLKNTLPIMFQDNFNYQNGIVVGETTGVTYSVRQNEDKQVFEIVVSGNIYYGGTSCRVNETKGDVVTDYSIKSVGFAPWTWMR